MEGDRERCLHVGMDGYVTKPINLAQLLATVDSVLGAAGSLAPAPPASADTPVTPLVAPQAAACPHR
jgi:DNA-binding response OmpR family regulator